MRHSESVWLRWPVAAARGRHTVTLEQACTWWARSITFSRITRVSGCCPRGGHGPFPEDPRDGRRHHRSLLDRPGTVVVSCPTASLDSAEATRSSLTGVSASSARWCSSPTVAAELPDHFDLRQTARNSATRRKPDSPITSSGSIIHYANACHVWCERALRSRRK